MRELDNRLMRHIDLLVERYASLESARNDIVAAYLLLEESYENGGKLLVAGNGGSAADAEHIVGELMKGFKLPRKPEADFAEKLVEENQELRQPLFHSARLICNDQAAVIRMTVRMCKERNQTTMFPVKCNKAIEVHIKHSICIQQEEVRGQLVLDFEKRASIAERLLFKIKLNMDTKGLSCHRGNSRSVPKVISVPLSHK